MNELLEQMGTTLNQIKSRRKGPNNLKNRAITRLHNVLLNHKRPLLAGNGHTVIMEQFIAAETEETNLPGFVTSIFWLLKCENLDTFICTVRKVARRCEDEATDGKQNV